MHAAASEVILRVQNLGTSKSRNSRFLVPRAKRSVLVFDVSIDNDCWYLVTDVKIGVLWPSLFPSQPRHREKPRDSASRMFSRCTPLAVARSGAPASTRRLHTPTFHRTSRSSSAGLVPSSQHVTPPIASLTVRLSRSSSCSRCRQ